MPNSKAAASEAATSERTKRLSAATTAANKRLKEAHLDEWNGYMAEEATARSETWSPKATPEQRAEQEFAALLEKFPHLAEKTAAYPVG